MKHRNVVGNHHISNETWRRTKRLNIIFQYEWRVQECVEVKINNQKGRNDKLIDDICDLIDGMNKNILFCDDRTMDDDARLGTATHRSMYGYMNIERE